MRQPDDIALRARNWFWYCLVRGTCDVPNEQLDRKFLAKRPDRVRFFQRILESASSPDDIPILNGKTLLEVVDTADREPNVQVGPFTPATEAFRSKFWNFLTERDAPPQVYTAFIQSHCEQRGWIRLPNKAYNIYATFLGPYEPAIEGDVGTAYSAMLHKLVNEETVDALAVLTALFREALANVDLKQAMAIQGALFSTLGWMCRRKRIPEFLEKLLYRLVEDRVLGNIWLTKADWRAATHTQTRQRLSSRERVAEFHAWAGWYVSRTRSDRRLRYGRYPIVPRSQRIDWVECNRDRLEQADHKVRDLRSLAFKLDDTDSRQEVADAQQQADALVASLRCPFDEQVRFYENEPKLTLGDLPRCY